MRGAPRKGAAPVRTLAPVPLDDRVIWKTGRAALPRDPR